MSERESKSVGPVIVSAILLVLALFSTYVAGYFFLGKTFSFRIADHFDGDGRAFKSLWLARIYWPMGKFESVITNGKIEVIYWPEHGTPTLPYS